MKLKKIVSVTLAIVMIVLIMPATGMAASIVASGSCGENAVWTLDSDGLLIVSGAGAMYDYGTDDSYTPWLDYKENIISVVIDDEIATIGRYAFAGCSRLRTVKIGNGIEKIGDYAFEWCDSLKTVEITGGNNATIGERAFIDCHKLSTVELGDGVTTIGQEAFSCCFALESIEIPDCVETLEDGVFAWCENLKIVDIGNGVKTIGSTFIGCYGLEEVILGDSVETIGMNAFSGCDSLVSIEIPDSVTTIGMNAFYNCINLYDIYYGGTEEDWNSKVTIGSGNDFNYVTFHFKEIKIIASGTCGENLTWALDSDGLLTISGTGAMIDYGTATAIYAPWLDYNENVKNVVIEDGVTTIGKSAFRYCGYIESAVIGNDVTEIGGNAFSECYSLKSIQIPDSVKSIGNSAFYNCEDLTDVKIGNRVEAIGEYAFSACYSLTELEIGNNVKTLGDYAFSFCTDLTDIDIPDSVTTIGEGAVSDCYSLTVVKIGSGIKTIGEYSFSNCNVLTDAHYNGTHEEWKNNVSVGLNNYHLLNATLHFKGIYTTTTVSNGGKTFTVKPENIKSGSVIILATYNGNKLAEAKVAMYNSQDITFTVNESYTKAKVFAWNDLVNFEAICEEETVKLN